MPVASSDLSHILQLCFQWVVLFFFNYLHIENFFFFLVFC